jgi:2-keto-4-pentenoate hydratase/2-oxohepta-3-ene-1,7-dioic acid hydratase in catechol pathway
LVAPREEVGDASGLEISLDVNGRPRQKASTAQMIHPVAALVSLASKLVTLERGDLIFTGTPSGVGPVVPGDVLAARLERVATLTVKVESAGP